MKKTLLINVLMAFAIAATITYFYPHPEANQYKFEEGRPWNYAKLIAPFDIPIRPDSATVANVRDSLDRTFAPVFERNNEAANEVITSLMGQWANKDGEQPPTDYDATMRKRAVAVIRSAYMRDILDDNSSKLIDEGSMPEIRILEGGVMSRFPSSAFSSVQKAMAEITEQMAEGNQTDQAIDWLKANAIEEALVPNLIYERETSHRLYNDELTRLNARMGAVNSGVIQQGQTIIDKGTIITSQDYTNLMTYERMINEHASSSQRSQWLMWLGQFLYIGLIIVALMCFLKFSSIEVWNNFRAMMFIFAALLVFFVVGVLLDSAVSGGIFLVPFAIVPVLMIVFFDAPTAIFTSLSLILLCAGAVAFPLEFIILQVLASVSAVYSLKELSKRSQLLRTSLFVMASYLLAYLAIELMMNGSTAGMGWNMVIYLAISAVLSSMAYILMVAIERMFGFVSIVTLIELNDTNNPLLRELSQECPGTFQHSMAVGNLASDAAIQIHANEQLVRAGAMYHDIGKMANPNFYTENQRGVNPHDALSPEQSARVIIGHIKDGIERADRAGLPEVIKDFIRQHHGRGKAKYFYFNYCKQHPDEEVDPTPFTYPGPNPQSREASLLMMADSVEAASRSLKQHTPQAIAELVNKIIDGQIAEGLHNDSPLEFRDVAVIKEAFIKRLMTMYHSRIVYPEDPNQTS